MSQLTIKNALEAALEAITPSLATEHQNQSFVPPAPTVPYQRLFVLFATPDNQVYGPEYQELGFLQINLMYPLGAGTAAADTRAALIKAAFPRGRSIQAGGITTIISNTADISPGSADGDRWVTIVRIKFFANITS